MKQILITGGAGFIGSNLTGELLKDPNNYITCVDNFDLFYPRYVKERNILPFAGHPRYKLIEGDIRNSSDLKKVGDVDVIIHMAAKAGVRPSIQDPLLYQDVNIAGTHNLLEFARLKNVGQFIFASSSSVYGINPNVPWNEEEKLLPISPYASSKLSDEMLGHVYTHLYGIRFLSLRFFTVYGPGQRPDLAIYKFFDLMTKDQPVPVYGDGNTFRDYTYISDMIKGIVAAISYTGSAYEIINLGNNKVITLNQLIAEIEIVCNKKAIIKRLKNQPGDVPKTFSDNTKAQNLLGYCPSTDLHNGLTAFYEWFKSL